jgi:hypothetical protein
MSRFRDALRADRANFPETVISRAERIYTITKSETLVEAVKRTGLPRKRAGFLAYVGAALESDRLGEDDQAFERRLIAALAWGGIEDKSGLATLMISGVWPE